MKAISILLFAAGVVGCGGPNQEIESRVKYWEKELSARVPPGTVLEHALEAAVTLDHEATYAGEESVLVLTLERIEDKSLVCSEWLIIAHLSLEEGRIKRTEVEGQGVCL